MNLSFLNDTARRIRVEDLKTVFRAGAGHIGGEMSAIDLLTALYFAVLKVDPANPQDPARDRFVLSKGHSACALYVTLAERGFFPKDELETFLKPHSRLNGHPNRVKVPGVETNTGPLGHGLPVAVGMAKAARITGAPWRTFVMTGDGELQEGSNWEALMAAAQFGLDNLTLIVDRNRLQQGARVEETVSLEPLAGKLLAFGWAVEEIDGHDIAGIVDVLDAARRVPGKPRAVIAHTNKGEGISFMRDRVEWHHKVPNRREYEAALVELGAA
jgi:transketolase